MNLLFIFTDQQHRDALGCMGTPHIDTPNLDRLAARGALFRRAYSSNPVCTPCRISMLTGLYGSTTDTHNNGSGIPRGVRTLADSLNDGGYRTSYVGKWHIQGGGHGPIPEEKRGGFTEFIGYQCYNGFRDNVIFYDEDNREHRFDGHRTDVTTDLAIERLRRVADQPFAMFVSYQAPHYPVQPSPEYEAMYKGRSIPPRPNRQPIDPYTPTFSPPSPKPPEDDPDYQRYGNDLDEYIRLYNAMVTQVDANIGRLLQTLDELGVADETAIVFTSDHGDMQGSHGLKNKVLPYEESAGIPLIVAVPGRSQAIVSDTPVNVVDYYPTILDLLGVADEPGLEGESLLPIFDDLSAMADRVTFSERKDWCMICNRQWKLAADRAENGSLTPTLLFDLEQDPYEMSNRVDDAAAAAVRDALLRELSAWNQRVCTRSMHRLSESGA